MKLKEIIFGIFNWFKELKRKKMGYSKGQVQSITDVLQKTIPGGLIKTVVYDVENSSFDKLIYEIETSDCKYIKISIWKYHDELRISLEKTDHIIDVSQITTILNIVYSSIMNNNNLISKYLKILIGDV